MTATALPRHVPPPAPQPVSPSVRAEPRWARPAGTALLGRVSGSGLARPAYLVRRPDGQVVQVSELVNTVLARLDPRRTAAEVAAAVSSAYGRTLTADGLHHLVTMKLRPAGLADDAATQRAPGPAAPRSAPLLSLALRGTVVPARAVRRVARVLTPTFHPAVVAAVLAAWVAVVVAVVLRAQVLDAVATVLRTPAVLVGVFALMTFCELVHELGHAVACSSSGATPGRVGVGVYLLAPAFFTNVTDSYRLGRAGRLRTDLGGLYYTVWCMLAVAIAQLATGDPVLLVVLVLLHVEAAEQLLPAVRLDGYYVLADLAGVPDLFGRVAPVLRSVLPGRAVDPRVADMLPWARRAVTAWVLLVVPLLAGGLVWLAWHVPQLARTLADAVAHQWSLLDAALVAHQWPGVALGLVSLALLAVPVAGVAAFVARIVQTAAALVRRRYAHTRHEGRDRERSRRQIMDAITTPGAHTGPGRADDDAGPGAPRPPAAVADPWFTPELPSWSSGFDLLAALGREPAVPGQKRDAARAPAFDDARHLDAGPGAAPAPPARTAGLAVIPAAARTTTLDGGPEGGPDGGAARGPEGGPGDGTRLSGLTAADLTDATVLGAPRRVAATGWRRAVRAGTHGAVALGPSRAELRHEAVLDRVRTPIDGTRRVLVMSRKGGVGKTSVTVGLGATFASLRGDRVVAVDANPDAGNLARRIAGDCDRTVTDLLADADRIDSFSTMRRYTSQCPESRLEVLASNDDARITQALDRAAYERVVGLLDHYYNLVLLDTGTGILDSANQGLLAEADELVLVLRPALDGARAGAQTLDWLEEHGHGNLVGTAVVVVNGVADPADPAVGIVREHFEQRCAHVALVPWDKTLLAGGRTTLGALAPRTREAFMQVAAALADSFHERGRADR
ncbi:MinD/ParA family protein [Xylanimonas allomyrinae]|uniref:MinD/ParA family protein n=1 Tax=Xylanimonas allomyrinae TaxID=2509459 RepID=A0A4P6EST0_9MICO|nr:MinD/ParA family protein [Xylanimonas allomyrinae]QAY64619.1 MinD/ParA family protein [Xylanimonas allomyrinae]